ncbi:MAG: hypothetical protein WAT81_03885 [Candidatus Moraniibacteriota bacterium]
MNDFERQQTKAIIAKELNRAKRIAVREIIKVETELVDTLDTVERYVKRHPLQAAAVTLSLGAAIGAAGALYLKRKSR